MIRVVMGAVAIAAALVAFDGAWAQPVFSPSQDPMAGARVFAAKGCEKCHSINGVGGKVGPDLAKSARPHSFYDVAAALWNHLPRMTDRMKQLGIARPELTSQEAGDLIGFLYTLGYFDRPGDAAAGRKLFVDKKCSVCHSVGGAGGTVGPKLDSLKHFASPMYLASAMWNHGVAMAEAMKVQGIERPTMTPQELRDLSAYLAPATGRPAAGPLFVLPGRPEMGRSLFVEKGCVQCHKVGGSGPSGHERKAEPSRVRCGHLEQGAGHVEGHGLPEREGAAAHARRYGRSRCLSLFRRLLRRRREHSPRMGGRDQQGLPSLPWRLRRAGQAGQRPDKGQGPGFLRRRSRSAVEPHAGDPDCDGQEAAVAYHSAQGDGRSRHAATESPSTQPLRGVWAPCSPT